LKIVDVQVFINGPGRNFVTLKIYTDEGVYGLGAAPLIRGKTSGNFSIVAFMGAVARWP
jgi:L-alanine-DL-glutamate epimerase-like enolase superfamily enzyme